MKEASRTGTSRTQLLSPYGDNFYMSYEPANRRPATGNRQPAMRMGNDIAERLLELGLAAIRLASSLPKDPAARHVGLQLVRSATGAGANYEEARGAESRADFVHKLGIAAKEVRESRYWMSLVQRSG